VKTSSPDVPAEDMRPKLSWTASYSVTVTESPCREPVQLSQSDAIPAEIPTHPAETNINNGLESEDLLSITAEVLERADGSKAVGSGTPADSAAPGTSFLTGYDTFSEAKEHEAIKEVRETVSFAKTIYKLVWQTRDLEQPTDRSPLCPQVPELERPKSPWTPSYSVIKQGSPLSDSRDAPAGDHLNGLELLSDPLVTGTVPHDEAPGGVQYMLSGADTKPVTSRTAQAEVDIPAVSPIVPLEVLGDFTSNQEAQVPNMDKQRSAGTALLHVDPVDSPLASTVISYAVEPAPVSVVVPGEFIKVSDDIVGCSTIGRLTEIPANEVAVMPAHSGPEPVMENAAVRDPGLPSTTFNEHAPFPMDTPSNKAGKHR
jgi:hypothetical protein